MKAEKLYRSAWALLENLTPLPIDCGALCGGACCDDGGQDDAGMYLFYKEELMYKNNPDSICIEESEFLYGDDDTRALIAMCPGKCKRSARPLACRIFPLAPYKKEGEPLRIIMDPRARAMCPLAKTMRVDKLDERFVHTVTLIFKVLIRNKKIRDFIIELSYLMDEIAMFYDKKPL